MRNVFFTPGTKQTKQDTRFHLTHTMWLSTRRPLEKKVISWVGMVGGITLPVMWFVNSDVYIAKVLKKSVWHAAKDVATRLQCWFQQNSIYGHVVAPCLQLPSSKFGDRLISRCTYHHHWPPYSAELSPLLISLSVLKQWHTWLSAKLTQAITHCRRLRSQHETRGREKDRGMEVPRKGPTFTGINRVDILNI